MPHRYSVIVSTRDISTGVNWHRGLDSPRTQVILIENRGRCSLGQAYNEGLEQAEGDFCCFIHDDAFVRSAGWLDRLAQAVVVDLLDLVGVAGTTRLPRTGGWWDSGRTMGRGRVSHYHPDGTVSISEYGPPDDPHRGISHVASLDGLLLFGKTRSFKEVPFDVDLFQGFHFYDSDLCLRWLLWHGRRLGVLHGLDVLHRAGPSLQGWQEDLPKFHYRHGGFLPLSLADVPLWSDNLQAIKHQDSLLAERLTSRRRPGSLLSGGLGENGLPVAKQATGDVSIADDVKPTPRVQGEWVVLFGAGSGHWIEQLLLDDDRPIVVIEPESHLLCWLLTRYHWATPIYEGRLRLVVPPLDQPSVREVSLHETIANLQDLVKDQGPPEWIETGTSFIHRDFFEAIRDGSGRASEAAERVSRWPSSRAASDEATVISPQCRIFDDLAQCLNQAGCPTRLLSVPDRPTDWSRTKYLSYLRQLLEHQTPIIFTRNRALFEVADPRMRLCMDALVPGRIVHWWWDEPTIASVLDWRNASIRRPALGFARELVTKLPAGSRWLPPAARSEFLSEQVDFSDASRDLTLTFVGQSRFDLMRTNLNVLANALDFYHGTIGSRLAREINACSSMQDFHRTLAHLDLEIDSGLADIRQAMPAIGYYLDYLRRMNLTAAFRLAAVESLRSFPLIVFGDDGWVRSGAIESSQFSGLIAPDQIASIYRRSRLNLNFNFMQVSSTVNPKVLDILAGGNAVLTDYRPELDELFPDVDDRPPSFQKLEELPDLVSTLLRGKLDDVRSTCCKAVRSMHTMHHRARWLIREFRLPTHRAEDADRFEDRQGSEDPLARGHFDP